MSRTPARTPRVYHGRRHRAPGLGPEFTITVERPESGPTERRYHLQMLYELHPADRVGLGGFGWGYNGTGTSRAAAAILADALDLGDAHAAGMDIESLPQDETLVDMREDFCHELLAQMYDDWRLHLLAVHRWAHSWHHDHGIAPPPALTTHHRPGPVSRLNATRRRGRGYRP